MSESSTATGAARGEPPSEAALAAVDSLRPVFIIGCGHSGTTLLTAMLDSHPRMHAYPGESNVFLRPLTARSFAPLVEQAAEARRLGKAVLVEKTPRHVHAAEQIARLLPAARFVYLVRDGRDVADSLRRRGASLAAGIERWLADNEAGLAALARHPGRVTLLRYEDLVADPAATLAGLCAFLGEAYDEAMLRYHEIERSWFLPKEEAAKPLSELSGARRHLARRERQIGQPLFNAGGTWRELPEDERELLQRALGPMLARLGYDVAEAPPPAPAIGGQPCRVYFHGNCQLPLLAKLIAEVRPHWRIAAREVHGREVLAQEAELRRDAAEADIIVTQPISEGYRGVDWLSLGAVRAMARPGCTLLRLPSLYFDGQLPGWGYIGAGAERLRGLRMPYHCYPAIAMVLAGMPPQEVPAALLAPDLFEAGFVEARFEAAVAELRRRERAGETEITASDLYAARGRERPVAHTVNHPLRHIAAEMANRVLRAIGERADVPEGGPDHLPLPHIPLFPSVEKALGLRPDPERHFNLTGVKRPPGRYLARLAEHYAALPAEALRGRIAASREARGFLDAFATAHPQASWAAV